jgi:hypothetical protein
MSRAAAAVTCLALALAAGCRPSGGAGVSDPPDAAASPQASAQPAPLANAPTTTASASAAAALDGGPPPTPMRPDQPLLAEATTGRESPGYTLSATLHVEGAPASPKGPEYAPAAFEAARKKTEARFTIDLSSSRLRVALDGGGFVLPQGVELRSRADRFGHVVMSADGASYRIAAPGALHALFGERRLDVAPLSTAELGPPADGARRLGYRTRRVEVATRAATATFEIAKVADAGEGGELLCRLLLDLVNAPPSTPLCTIDEVPMHAELAWTTRGVVVFDAVSIVRRLDLAPAQLAAPPSSAAFAWGPIPTEGASVLLTPAELAAMRPLAPNEPRATLVFLNVSDVLRFLYVDGVPVAWAAPGARGELRDLGKTHYAVEWRSFFGDAADPSRVVTPPAITEAGSSDAGR